MSFADKARAQTRSHPRIITAVISVIGYTLVIGAFLGVVPIPDISRSTVILLSDLIAVINSTALIVLLAGWRFIKRGDIRKHRAAMSTAFVLIMTFLVLYLIKVGGGFEKGLVIKQGQFLAQYASFINAVYLAMLVIHILLSVISVPVVLHAIVLGISHPIGELPNTLHPRVGRVAVVAWTLSLSLGIITYFLLNHVYSWEIVRFSVLPLMTGEGVRTISDRAKFE
ncbi:MAG: DUF420 domain-containing protein [Halobacteriaceae archaeon]